MPLTNRIDYPIHVLLIEDDEEDAFLTESLLKNSVHSRYHITWVSNVDAAYQSACQSQWDVVLVDYNLGKQSGIELIQKIHEHKEPTFPFILLTGTEDLAIDNMALENKVSDYLVKGNLTTSLLDRSIRYAIANQHNLVSLQESERTKGLFFAALAHDLKTPIHAEYRVLGMIQDGFFGELPESLKVVIAELVKSNRFKHHIVDNLLATYKYNTHTFQLQKEMVELNPMIEELLKGDLATLAAEKHHDIQLLLKADLPELFLDPVEIQRVLRNLIQNAIFYTPDEGKISITTAIYKEFLHIQIQDNGPGIPIEKQDKLFQPFSVETKKLKHIGSGLGLYLSKELVEAHHGLILFASDKDYGSTFMVVLPLQQQPNVILPMSSLVNPL